MKKFAFAGVVAALAITVAGSASAAVVTGFTPNGSSPAGGYTVIDSFDNVTGITGSNYILTTNHDTNGAPPANSTPYGSSYLSVMGGGTASINFAALTSGAVNAFEFDWGSIDSYNSLVIHSSTGDITIVPGTLSFPNAANGDQIASGTNGLFRVTGNAGETFSGITLASGSNAFEIDNLAVAGVPEPAAWAMMIMGMGSLGVAMRNRRKVALAAAA